jgi:thiol-disulfide isomerase/thioredoxin
MTVLLPPVSPVSDSDATLRQRRRMFGTAAAAVVAGLGYGWWRQNEPAPAEPVPGFWSLQWESPQGEVVRAEPLRGKLLLVNFWATWCPPCVEELPLINAFYRENKANGWQVLALAVDKLVPVQGFLVKTPLDFPVGMAGLSGTGLGRSLGNLTGGLPFSVVVDRQGAVLQRKLGRLTANDLEQWRRLK